MPLCRLCFTHTAWVQEEALNTDAKGPFKGENLCIGGKEQVQFAGGGWEGGVQGEEGMKGCTERGHERRNGYLNVQEMENLGDGKCLGADLPLREGGG